MRLYAIEETHTKSLAAVMKRLFSEERMNGDEMRNCAQTIEAVVRFASQMEVPDTLNEKVGSNGSGHR